MKPCTGVQSQVKRTPNLTDWGLLVAEGGVDAQVTEFGDQFGGDDGIVEAL